MNNKKLFSKKPQSIKCGDIIIDFSTPKIMGILNLTPDSFYDGGKYFNNKNYIEHTAKMLEEGADIIDIGGVSTRPGAKPIEVSEELIRVLPPLKNLKKMFPDTIFSVDTYRSEIAKACVNEGATIINDISGGTFDENMFATIAKLKIPYVLMHIYKNPEIMQQNPIKKNCVEIIRIFFEKQITKLQEVGVRDIILDPGFGFGKSMPCNYSLLKHLEELRINDFPLLTGISRKSLVNKILETTPDKALNGTTVLHTIALINGANILRAHDVKEALETIKIFGALQNI